jgi:uncharacterized protein (TIGR02246 family)
MDPNQLVEIEQIKQLKARYFRLLDTKQWDAWGDVFTEDCHMQVELGRGDPDATWQGRKDIVESVQKTLADSRTVHHGHMPEIELTGPTTARGIWAMYDYVTWGRDDDLKAYGHYHETYEKEAGDRWRIKTLHLKRLRVDSRGDW